MRIRALLIITLLLATASALRGQTRRVVVIYDERTELPGLAALDASLVGTLKSGANAELEIYRESMDLSRLGRPGYQDELRDHLRAKFSHKQIDVVVTVMGPALDFVLEFGDGVFPGAAIVFSGIDRRELAHRELPSHATGVLMKREFRPTLELALRTQPKTRNVVVVGGSSEFDRLLMQQIRSELKGFEDQLNFTYLTDLPMAALLQRLTELPPKTIVLYSTIFRDGAGAPFVPHEVVERVTRAANAPVYGFVDQFVGRGIVGGHMYSLSEHGKVAAQLALAMLSGRPAAAPPIRETGANTTILDWRQLRRWDIDAAVLPAGADIRFRPPSAWEQFRTQILIAVAIAIFQMCIIVLLLLERMARRRSEKRYALASAAGSVGVWDWNVDADQMYVDPFIDRALGYRPQHARRRMADWSKLIHRDDFPILRERLNEAAHTGSPVFEAEARMLRADGGIEWFLIRGSIVIRRGRLVRATGTAIDITERKHAQHILDETQLELARVSQLSALAEFAASVAHELRQPLASVTLNVEACQRWLNDPSPDLDEIRAALHDVMHASRRADELMQRSRDLFKMHAIRKEQIELNDLVYEAADLAKATLQRRGVILRTDLDDRLPPIYGDRIELQQALLNLIANGIDATQQLAPSMRRIEIKTSLTDLNHLCVSVRDNGQGLATVDMRRLFKISYTTKENGSGIGLSLCRSIVEAHGGRIWAEDDDGGGARFTFTLPPASENEPQASWAPPETGNRYVIN